MFEKCVKVAGDPQCRSPLQEVSRLADGFMKCLESRSAEDCMQECLKECRGEGCGEACLGALNAAVGMAVARSIIEITETAASHLNMNTITAAAWAFYEEVEKIKEMDCPEKEVVAWILAVATIELYKHFKKKLPRNRVRELLLLMAPPLAEAYQCVGDGVFEYLDSIRPIVGKRAVEKIIREMKEGGVFVGGVLITFKPVGAKQ
jgi:hypothetical protein